MKVLFLDDDFFRMKEFKRVNPQLDVDYALTASQGRNFLENSTYDVAYLDHDLGNDIETGEDFVRYIVNKNIKLDKIICHSMNPLGRERMVRCLRDNNYNVLNFPFAWTQAWIDTDNRFVTT